MALLMLFALLAGAATALSPCVLPVLPAVLGAGVGGGRRRPLGVVTGLVLAFTFATVALVYVIAALGLPDGFVRTLAIVTLLAAIANDHRVSRYLLPLPVIGGGVPSRTIRTNASRFHSASVRAAASRSKRDPSASRMSW